MDHAFSHGEAYVNLVLDIIFRHGLGTVDLTYEQIKTMHDKIRRNGCGECRTRYMLVRQLLQSLDDSHAQLIEPDQVRAWIQQNVAPDGDLNSPPFLLKVTDNIGYIAMRSLPSTNRHNLIHFIEHVHTCLAIFVENGIEGWIVDIRSCRGDDEWAHLACMAPLIGPGLIGSYVSKKGTDAAWWYTHGQVGFTSMHSFNEHDWYASIKFERGILNLRSLPPVAVLTGPLTARAGEALAIAFRGREKCRSFGQRTRGEAIRRSVFSLPDGSMLTISTGHFADRTGRVYHGSFIPDEEVWKARLTDYADMETETKVMDDPAVQRGVGWLGHFVP